MNIKVKYIKVLVICLPELKTHENNDSIVINRLYALENGAYNV